MTTLTTPALPDTSAPWTAWRDYGLAWARSASQVTGAAPVHDRPALTPTRQQTMYAYREARPGPRWRALYDATWPAYRAWYLGDRSSDRPSLAECREALERHMPELVGTWERLAELTGNDPVAARMLSMWRLPPFAVGCSQLVVPGERPLLLRNYDYEQSLFEGVIASTDFSTDSRSGGRRVLGTSDLLWGLLDGMNDAGLVVSLTYGGRPGSGDGFGVPLVLRYLLETCGDVAAAVTALRRLPVAQSYNIALADTAGHHATVFVAPGEPATVSGLEATTNHRLDRVEHVEIAARLNSVGRQDELVRLRGADADQPDLVGAMLAPPLRNDQFDAGFGTLYTVEYRPHDGTATWHWPTTSWTRRYDDPDGVLTVPLPPN